MKRIPLSQGKVALVDDEDYDRLRRLPWHAHRVGRRTLADQFYAAHNPPSGVKIMMHNVILKPPEGYVVDHINFDGLDNRRANLRIVSRSENAKHREAPSLREGEPSLASVRGIRPSRRSASPSHPLFRARVVFTGAMTSMTRKEAWQLANDCGAICRTDVSRSTDFVVVGNRDYARFMAGEPSGRLKAARELVDRLFGPRVISETQFLELTGYAPQH